jgi:thiol-disulfide isomerase/thioredoxin
MKNTVCEPVSLIISFWFTLNNLTRNQMSIRSMVGKKSAVILTLMFFSPFVLPAQTIDGFILPNVVDNTEFSLSELKGERVVVIIFLSSKCAFVDHYLERIILIKNEYASKGVQFVLINSNNSEFVEQESEKEMEKFVNNHNLSMPYLADKKKVAKTLLGATRTPEAFIIIPDKNQFTVVYKGAIDDSPHSPGDVNHHYLQDTLFNLLNNIGIEMNQTRPIGCLIK